ncbi:type IV pilus protein [Aureimonas endophytica]|uniref:Type IV pilus protein n=1 Tax=Aureimonas endophytica TaxID=2027858 RepID=A0A916ZQS1_9HYPH|nr:CpaD family pilus assembly lipoprotein [Aureimonas endophytica]GGE09628.1 type IV pilus protein [Aureimonas endophytica]
MSAPRSLNIRRAAGLALVGALLLAGCADRHAIEVGSVPDDYRTRHPIVVGESEVAIELPIASSEIRLSENARSRIEDFGQRFRGTHAAALRVLLPRGSANEKAAALASRDVVATLRRIGVAGDRILVQPYDAAGEGGPVPIRLSFATLTAKTAPCGRWPDQLADTEQNRNYFNFGCATQQNLAAQVADPRDLLGPRGRDPVDAARRTNMLEDYRLGRSTASDRSRTESTYNW